MKSPKEFYRTYQSDDGISEFNKLLAHEVLKQAPNHVFEFGCGTGKNLRLIQKIQSAYALKVSVSGLDISLLNVLSATVKNELQHIAIGDENYLRHYCNYDVVITCSVLDHIENIDGIIQELQRIANKSVILAECVESDESKYYYAHDFSKYGFEMIKDSGWFSEADGHTYQIYKWDKQNETPLSLKEFANHANDDLGIIK